MDERNAVLHTVEDRIREARERYAPTHTAFLDAREQSEVRKALHWQLGGKESILEKDGVTLWFTGGAPDAERQVLFCLPDYYDPAGLIDPALRKERAEKGERLSAEPGAPSETAAGALLETPADDELRIVRITHAKGASAGKSRRALAHGDYLGSILGLGIDRNVTGDIYVREDGADIVVLARMAEFLARNLTRIGAAPAGAEVLPVSEVLLPVRGEKEISDTVASLRLDNLLSAAFRISRGQAQDAVRQGLVFVDHIEASKPDQEVPEGAVLVIRHRGRARLVEVGGETKKGRTRVTFRR